MTEQEEANITAAIRGVLAEITMGVCTDASGNGRYTGFCASEVARVRAAWVALHEDRARLKTLQSLHVKVLVQGLQHSPNGIDLGTVLPMNIFPPGGSSRTDTDHHLGDPPSGDLNPVPAPYDGEPP